MLIPPNSNSITRFFWAIYGCGIIPFLNHASKSTLSTYRNRGWDIATRSARAKQMTPSAPATSYKQIINPKGNYLKQNYEKRLCIQARECIPKDAMS
jgi:hypothetical protein